MKLDIVYGLSKFVLKEVAARKQQSDEVFAGQRSGAEPVLTVFLDCISQPFISTVFLEFLTVFLNYRTGYLLGSKVVLSLYELYFLTVFLVLTVLTVYIPHICHGRQGRWPCKFFCLV